MVFPEIIHFIEFLNSLSTQNFKQKIYERIFNSDEIQISRAAYFLTPEGFDYFQNLDKEKKDFEITQIKSYLNYYFGSRFLTEEENELNTELFERQFDFLINMIEIPDLGNIYEFWTLMRTDPDLSLISEIALRLLSMPCSEAAVERLFSHMKYLFGNRNTDSAQELVNAELGIKMDKIFDKK